MRSRKRLFPALFVAVAVAAAACSSGGGSGSAEAVAPLTGEPGADGVDPNRRAIGVKIDDTSPGRPQAGVGAADLVYEEVVEGGLTRLMAVFQSRNADSVGPVRSVRPVDPELALGLGDAVLAFSGGAEGVLAMVTQSGVTALDENNASAAFERESSRSAPYNLFSSTDALYKELDSTDGAPPQLAQFDDLPSGMTTQTANTVEVRLERDTPTEWRYDETGGVYTRYSGGEPVKLADGSNTQAQNLVFQSVELIPTNLTDANGAAVPDWKVTGQGKLGVAREGKLVTGTWIRSSDTDVAELTDDSGNEIPLTPGTTWWTLVPSDTGSVAAS